MSAPPAPVDGEIRAKVLAWMAEHGRGYKAASAEFGVPRSTIQSWAHAERDGAPQKARARAPARDQARPQRPAGPGRPSETLSLDPDEPWDPTTCTREVWLRRGMVRAMERSRLEQEAHHGGTAARWEAIAGKYRNELDELLEEQRLAGLAPAPVDLVKMSRELAALLPALVRMDPERWAAAVDLAMAEVTKYRGTLEAK